MVVLLDIFLVLLDIDVLMCDLLVRDLINLTYRWSFGAIIRCRSCWCEICYHVVDKGMRDVLLREIVMLS